MYISKIGDCLKILTDNKEKVFLIKNFGEYLKSTNEKLYFKLREEQSLRKVAELFYIFLTAPNEVKKYDKILI